MTEKYNNTKNFHTCASISKKQKETNRIKIGRCILSRKDEVKNAIRNHFRDNFLQECIPNITFREGSFNKLERSTSQYLDRIPDEQEIKDVVWSYCSHKVLGYNGFNFGFIKKCWDIIGNEFTRNVLNFFTSGHFDRVINTTWVTLIPKIPNPLCIDEYRPISMLGCIYKSYPNCLPIGLELN